MTAGQGYLLGRPSPVRAADPLDLDALSGPPPLPINAGLDVQVVLAEASSTTRLSV